MNTTGNSGADNSGNSGNGSAMGDDTFRLANGIIGQNLRIETANPLNYHQAISDTTAMPRLHIQGKLFLPTGAGADTGPYPVVIIVPGSLGLGDHHVAKAGPLTDQGIAACVIDPFGARAVSSTVANQAQFSYAASAWDVLATAAHLAGLPDIDATRIGAQGHSRGGTAVLSAAARALADAAPGPALAAVYAAYPWCGHQFADTDVGATKVRSIIGDRDEWCLPQQVQAHMHALRAGGSDATFRMVAGAHHSFDRPVGLDNMPDAAVAPGAPTAYIDNNGAFIHPATGAPDPALTDRTLFIYAAKAGYAIFGAHIGGGDENGLADLFHQDVMNFWANAF